MLYTDKYLQSMLWPLLLSIMTTNCSLALHAGKCTPADNTIECCLKERPESYEQCVVAAGGTRAAPTTITLAPPITSAPDVPDEDERREWEERCRSYYVRCIEAGGGGKRGRKFDETLCQACWDACRRYGFWPYRANGKLCPGSEP